MPSEDLKETPVYDFKLDIFSFQYLTFYVAAQQLPSVHELNDKAMYAALKKRTVQIQRRRRAIGGERFTQCLQDKLERRPTMTELNASLIELCTKHLHRVAEVSRLMAQRDKVCNIQ